jgi:ubiquinone biosynthesis protein
MMRLMRPFLAPAARRVLGDCFEPEEIRRVLGDAFDDYDRRRPALPEEQQTGPRWMVHLAALTAGLYRALLARGLAEAEARRRTAEVTWLVYEKMAAVPWALARLMEREPYGRLEKATDLLRRFPFRAPSYDMVDVPAERDVVAFDVRRCPVAEYLRAEGLSELCVEAWCNLDILLANKWGARLERTGTLAQGAERCDFRWRLRANGVVGRG